MCEIESLSIESIRLRAKVSVAIVTNSGQNVIVSAHLYTHNSSKTTNNESFDFVYLGIYGGGDDSYSWEAVC